MDMSKNMFQHRLAGSSGGPLLRRSDPRELVLRRRQRAVLWGLRWSEAIEAVPALGEGRLGQRYVGVRPPKKWGLVNVI